MTEFASATVKFEQADHGVPISTNGRIAPRRRAGFDLAQAAIKNGLRRSHERGTKSDKKYFIDSILDKNMFRFWGENFTFHKKIFRPI